MENQTVTAISGIRVGHATNETARTGCTVVLYEPGAVLGVDVRGGAPGTRGTDVHRPENLAPKAHGVLLTGGSAYGLDAVGGVMAYLEERGVGIEFGTARIPVVPGAVIFDLRVGDPTVRPDKAMGYQACVNATDAPVQHGSIGAGTGATVGKAPGLRDSDGGVGSSLLRTDWGLLVGAIVVVNAVGNVVDPSTGRILAGATHPETGESVDLLSHLLRTPRRPREGENTTIGVIVTNARLDPAQATKVAQMGHDGMARAIRPSHTPYDGDTLFTMATGEVEADVLTVGALAAEAVAAAIVDSVSKT